MGLELSNDNEEKTGVAEALDALRAGIETLPFRRSREYMKSLVNTLERAVECLEGEFVQGGEKLSPSLVNSLVRADLLDYNEAKAMTYERFGDWLEGEL